MNDFVEQEWKTFCKRLQNTASDVARGHGELEDRFLDQAKNFIGSNHPKSYTELLQVTDEGTQLAISWQEAVGNEMAYTNCDNHEPMPVPTETMAEQAEQVRSQA